MGDIPFSPSATVLAHVRLPQGDLVLEPQADLGYVGSRLLKCKRPMGSVDMTSPEAKAPRPSTCTAEAAFIGNEKSAKVTQKNQKSNPVNRDLT